VGVLEAQGLDCYVDARYLQREVAEAHDLTEAEMDKAAHALRHSGLSNTSHPSRQPYYEHLGGYTADELRDYNQYSRNDDLKSKQGYTNDYSDADEMVYVTTL
jgi:hypothetical protein